jgi:hypothetical protein
MSADHRLLDKCTLCPWSWNSNKISGKNKLDGNKCVDNLTLGQDRKISQRITLSMRWHRDRQWFHWEKIYKISNDLLKNVNYVKNMFVDLLLISLIFPSNLFFPDILLEFQDQGHSVLQKKWIMQLNLILFLINMGILAKNELSNLDEKNYGMQCMGKKSWPI